MTIDVDIDIDFLKTEIKKTYASVSEGAGQRLRLPDRRACAEDLDYPAELSSAPESAVESFAGVANPFTLGPALQLAS